MSIFLNYPKEKCVACGKKYYPKFCKICRLRDFTTCAGCHQHTKHHKREASKIAG